MLSQSCLQPNWSPHQLPHGWGHRGHGVPCPSPKAPLPLLPRRRRKEEEAAGLVSGSNFREPARRQ